MGLECTRGLGPVKCRRGSFAGTVRAWVELVAGPGVEPGGPVYEAGWLAAAPREVGVEP